MIHRTRPAIWRYLKPLLDAGLVVISFGLAYWMRYDLQFLRALEPAFYVAFDAYTAGLILLVILVVGAFWIEGAYRSTHDRLLLDEFYIVIKGTITGIAASTIIAFYVRPSYHSRLIFGFAGVLILVTVSVARVVESVIVARRRQRGIGVTRVLLVGADENARILMRAIVARPDLGYRIVGFVDDDPVKATTDIGPYSALGTIERLPELIRQHRIDEVIVTLPWSAQQQILQVMGQCARYAVRTRIVPDLFQMTLRNVVVESIDGVPLLGVAQPMLRGWQLLAKRALDMVASALVLVGLAPIWLLVALAIRLDSPGPVLYKQVRLGRGGGRFTCLKFRTMCANAEALQPALAAQNEASGPLFKMRHDPRRTRVGRYLRHGIDEIPQLWNVLKGEMSLIGPRPPIPSEVEGYEPWHLRRLEVRPGITGLWQVSGRSNLTFDEMVLLDLYYIENWSPLLDLRILLKTIPVVLMGSGAY